MTEQYVSILLFNIKKREEQLSNSITILLRRAIRLFFVTPFHFGETDPFHFKNVRK